MESGSGVYGVYCAVIATTKNVLRSGLEKLLLEACQNKSLSCEQICKLTSAVVHYQAVEMLGSIESKLVECDEESHSINPNYAAIDISRASNEKSRPPFGCVMQGQHGRMMTATQGVGRGIVLLKETPYVCCVASECGCREGSLLVEHLAIADVIKRNNQQETSSKFSQFKNSFFSGLNVCVTGDLDASCLWDNHSLFVLMVASAILTLYQITHYHTEETLSHIMQTRMVDKVEMSRESLELLQILSRLPPNLHAISHIVSDPSISASPHQNNVHGSAAVSNIVQQVRVGYGLFLTASAVNHSCRPNCAIRFEVDSATHDNEYTVGYSTSNELFTPSAALSRLMRTSVDVVATDSIPRGGEAFVSYGPLYGKHDVDTRRKCLRHQYLFDCFCRGCSEDLAIRADTVQMEEARLSGVHPTSNKAVEDSIYLCRRLEVLSSSMSRVNAEFSVVSQSFSRSGDRSSLGAFERQRLLPLRDDLDDLLRQYFPQYISTEGQPPPSHSAVQSLFLELCGVRCNYLDLQAHVHALRSEFLPAAALVLQAIQIMTSSGQYRDDDVVIGRERVKLAQLLLSGGDLTAGRRVVERALQDLRPFVGADDPDWQEALSMQSFLLRSVSRRK